MAEEFASPDLELHWLDEDEGEPETVLEGRLKVGALTLNEMRDALGLDPFDNAAADRPMVLTATGFVPIEANAGGEGADASMQNAETQTPPIIQKYGYSPDQPRVPAGNPAGGRWTDDEIRLAQEDTSGIKSDVFPPSQGRGHTWMPTAVYNKYKWKDETRNVFKNWTSGQLADPKVNSWSPEHDAYNVAADELLRSYLKKHNIDVDASEEATLQTTPEQAKEIVEEVLTTRDPRISGLRFKIKWQMLRYSLRYGVLRAFGDEE